MKIISTSLYCHKFGLSRAAHHCTLPVVAIELYVLSTAQCHLRTTTLLQANANFITFLWSIHKSNPYTNIKQNNIHKHQTQICEELVPVKKILQLGHVGIPFYPIS